MRTTILMVILVSLLIGCASVRAPIAEAENNYVEESVSSGSHHSTLSTRSIIKNAVIEITVKNKSILS